MTRRVVRIAYILLGVMTVASFGGPLLIGGVLKGGKSPDWPPDRSVEWVAFAGTTGLVLAVMAGLTGIWAANIKELNAAKARLVATRQTPLPPLAKGGLGGVAPGSRPDPDATPPAPPLQGGVKDSGSQALNTSGADRGGA